MFVEGSIHGNPDPEACSRAANEAIGFLEQIAKHMDMVKAPARMIAEPPRHLLIHGMWSAVTEVGDPDLTPMAAVAGTIADATADFLLGQGLTRIVVNNGGDVAIRLSAGETVTVGIRPDLNAEESAPVAWVDAVLHEASRPQLRFSPAAPQLRTRLPQPWQTRLT
jgi:uncharacterized protein